MRHLTLLMVLLLATVGLAAEAKAQPLPGAAAPTQRAAMSLEDEFDPGDEGEEGEPGEEGESESCEPDEEESCTETDVEAEGDECVLEAADVSVSANPGSGKVRVTIRYTAALPASFTVDYSLRGGKGGLHLGSARARFHRAGVFHDALTVGGKKLAKLQAARQLSVAVHAVGTPAYCREELTSAAPRRASRQHRAGA